MTLAEMKQRDAKHSLLAHSLVYEAEEKGLPLYHISSDDYIVTVGFEACEVGIRAADDFKELTVIIDDKEELDADGLKLIGKIAGWNLLYNADGSDLHLLIGRYNVYGIWDLILFSRYARNN